jgi:hypothetical protein
MVSRNETYFLFVWNVYYPSGGAGDHVFTGTSVKECVDEFESNVRGPEDKYWDGEYWDNDNASITDAYLNEVIRTRSNNAVDYKDKWPEKIAWEMVDS